MFKLIYHACLTEFSRIFKSKGLVTILILGPIIYGILYPQPYLKESIRNIPIAVVDNDNSAKSRELIRNINASDALNVSYNANSINEANEWLRQKKIYGILHIEQNFERDIIKGKPVTLPFYADASYLLVYNNAATALTTVILAQNSAININRQIAQRVDASVAKSGKKLFTPNLIPLFNPQSGYATYVIPPAFVLILHQILFVGFMVYMGIYRDKFKPFLTATNKKTPIFNSIGIVLGRTLTYTTLYFSYYWLFYFFISCLYQIPIIAPASSLILFSLVFIISTVLFAQFFSSFVKSIDLVFLLFVPLSMIIFFMAGVSWPTASMPSWMLNISTFVPAVTAIPLSTEIAQMGAPISILGKPFLILITLSAIYFILTIWRISHLIKKVDINT